MKKFLRVSVAAILAVIVSLGSTGPITAFATTSPTLAGSEGYSVLGGAEVTNTGATTTDGAVGVSPGTSITGTSTLTAGGGTQLNNASAIAAQADLTTATTGVWDVLTNQACDHDYADGTNLTDISPLVPGVYCSAGSFLLTGNLTLTGSSGVWIFKTVSTLITSSNSSVTGGDSCNVWWQIGSAATLGTTTSFIGSIVAANVADTTALQTGATLNGRILGQAKTTVTLNNNTITTAACSTTIAARTTAATQAAAAAATQAAATQAAATLPNTGIAPSQNSIPWNIAILAGILTASTLFVVIRRKKRAI